MVSVQSPLRNRIVSTGLLSNRNKKRSTDCISKLPTGVLTSYDLNKTNHAMYE